MKHKLLLLLFCSISIAGFAQEENEEEEKELNSFLDRKHELRIDAAEGLIVPAIDVSYEYIISKLSGAGISAYISLNSDSSDYQKFAITPFYRQYFFNKEEYGGKGFYAEGVLQFATGSDSYNAYQGDTVTQIDDDWSRFGIGVAFGQKWVRKNGFVVDIHLGGGRYFGSDGGGPRAFFRGGASLGYRF